MKIREYIQVYDTGVIPESQIDPNKLQIAIEADANQIFTIPTLNNFLYTNYLGNSTASGTLVYNYTVDWGDGAITAGINTYNSASRIHTYLEAGRYTIQISGTFPCWDTNGDAQIRLLITRVLSWGNIGLKKINFNGCTALIALPDQQSKLTSLLTAVNFCNGCTSLTAIPYGTFFGNSVVADFNYCFYNCAKLKIINATTFRDNTNAYTMQYAFGSCAKLESIPATLFSTNTLIKKFNYLFYSCSTLTSIPSALFQYNTAVDSDFTCTFYNCTAITSVPSGLFTNVKSATFGNTFSQCYSIATIPADLFKGQNRCTSFNNTFSYCYKLQGVPSGVFDLDVAGSNLCTNMGACFYNCGTDVSVTSFTIANNVFNQLRAVTTFASCFSTCTKLETIPTDLFKYCVACTSFSGTFSSSGVASIPSGLFSYCTLCTTFDSTFQATKITSIPSGLFSYCTEVTVFQSTFASCIYLISSGIPSDIFTNCTKVLYFGYGTIGSGAYYYGVFYNCTNAGFTSIPAGLFDSCVNVISMNGAFFGTKITSIPNDLLRYCTALTNAEYVFYGTSITSTTGNIFQYNRQITSVFACFGSCTQLTTVHVDTFKTYGNNPNGIVDFGSCFSGCTNVGFTTVPADLFKYSVNAKKFNNSFNSCTKFTTIPAGLFSYNTIAEEFVGCFYMTAITSIPSTLFTGLTAIKTFQNCFQYCSELTSIPSTLFDDQGLSLSVNWMNCFQAQATSSAYSKITSAAPTLWTKGNSPVGTACFNNRTTSPNWFSNSASIPAGWK